MKSERIKKLKEAHQRLLNALELTPNEGIISGKWTKIEIMAHIAGWYEEFDREVGAVSKVLKGERPISFRYSIDGYNRRSVKKRKKMGKAEILQEIKRSHQQFIKLIKELNEKQLTDYYGTILRGKPINTLWIINETIGHDNEHAEELEKKFSK